MARALHVPFLARDDVRSGLWFTAGAWTARPGPVPSASDTVEVFLQLVEDLVRLGVSAVVEYAFRTAQPEHLDRLTAIADCVVLRTRCTDAPARHVAREHADPRFGRPEVLSALGHDSIAERVAESSARMAEIAAAMRTEFDLPLLEILTDDGYDPPLDEVVAFVLGAEARPPIVDNLVDDYGADAMTERDYDDIPGTFVFDGRRSRQGYALNMFCMSLNDAANRDAFRADEEAYLDGHQLSDDQRRAVLDRDWNRLLELGGNIYYTFKLAACDGMTFQQLAAQQTGMDPEEYAAMMKAGGRPIDGNRSKGDVDG